MYNHVGAPSAESIAGLRRLEGSGVVRWWWVGEGAHSLRCSAARGPRGGGGGVRQGIRTAAAGDLDSIKKMYRGLQLDGQAPLPRGVLADEAFDSGRVFVVEREAQVPPPPPPRLPPCHRSSAAAAPRSCIAALAARRTRNCWGRGAPEPARRAEVSKAGSPGMHPSSV